jgi:hypothetical protein
MTFLITITMLYFKVLLMILFKKVVFMQLKVQWELVKHNY